MGMAEDGSGLVAASALDVHEIGVGSWDKSLEFVLLLLRLVGWVKKVSLHFNLL